MALARPLLLLDLLRPVKVSVTNQHKHKNRVQHRLRIECTTLWYTGGSGGSYTQRRASRPTSRATWIDCVVYLYGGGAKSAKFLHAGA